MNLIQHYINGKIYKGSSSRQGKVFNPASGAQESEVILGTKSDLDHAVENAKKASLLKCIQWCEKYSIQHTMKYDISDFS